MADLILKASWQQRKGGRVDSLLMEAAQYKADDMAAHGYFGHVSPSGEAPNDYVRRHEYPLPKEYISGKNNVESLAIGSATAEDTIALWLNSPAHRAHIMGGGWFYGGQIAVGIGLANHADGRRMWVFVSAPVQG
jgi:uncharacterized protein YkwD